MKNDIKNNPNSFLSRGCSELPGTYNKNENIFQHSCCKLDDNDWLKNIELPKNQKKFNYVEVRFKNSRKDFFSFSEGMELNVGDIIAVEASPGHDIGIISMTGEAVRLQMKKKNISTDNENLKKVYRRARATDIEKWKTAVEAEDFSIYKSREIANNLSLEMKINDVEYQGDNTKAIFYYTAEDRVDFRELIKLLAEEFKVRIEMRQIGIRQEASRIGGVGSCGRELCCSTWLWNFKSVSTTTARTQQLSLNPQKLAGQCGKLKCCLNFENDNYIDALKKFPNNEIILKTKKGEAVYQKTDIFKKVMWYSYVNDESNMLAIPIEKVQQIIEDNARKIFPEKLEDFAYVQERKTNYENSDGKEDLYRFD
jgi:cell fate regulator YaaT (PSP1 superfamily)